MGTTNPDNPLHIVSDDPQAIKIEDRRPTIFLVDTDESSGSSSVHNQFQIRNSARRLQFQAQNDAGSDSQTLVTIENSGNVGIGIAPPREKLHVGGDVKVEGLINGMNIVPVYRLWHSGHGHFYTTSSNERDNAVSSQGYIYEGIGFYALQPGS